MPEAPAAVFRRLTHGVYVIGVSGAGRDNAFTAAWVMQVSFDPLLLAVSIHPEHASYGLLADSGVFSVNVLPRGREDLARHFGRPGSTDKLAGMGWRRGTLGAPLLDEALAWLECELSHECPAGDHRLLIGRARHGAVADAGAIPMDYRDTGDMDGSSALFPDRFP